MLLRTLSRRGAPLLLGARARAAGLSILAGEVRGLQAPLKEKYAADAGSALIEMKAEGYINNENMTTTILGGPGQCVADGADGERVTHSSLHPAAGGDGTEACSGDMLLQSLVACAGVTLKAVWTAFGLGPVRSGRIVATGEMDFRGTLGVQKGAPVGLTKVDLAFHIDCDDDAAKVAKAVATTERFCVIYQTLKNGVPELEGRVV